MDPTPIHIGGVSVNISADLIRLMSEWIDLDTKPAAPRKRRKSILPHTPAPEFMDAVREKLFAMGAITNQLDADNPGLSPDIATRVSHRVMLRIAKERNIADFHSPFDPKRNVDISPVFEPVEAATEWWGKYLPGAQEEADAISNWPHLHNAGFLEIPLLISSSIYRSQILMTITKHYAPLAQNPRPRY
jgi:hypothetical protein